jgi:hypothetical protein
MSAADAAAGATAGTAPPPDAEQDATLGLPAEQVAKYTVATTFRGARVELLQVPRARGADGADITGWAAWEASNVLLRWAADDAHLSRALLGGGSAPCPPWCGLSVLDLSAGAGLVALAAAAAGAASVTACDIHPQLPQLVGNLRRGGLAVEEVLTPPPPPPPSQLGEAEAAAPAAPVAQPPAVRHWAPIRRGAAAAGEAPAPAAAGAVARVVPFWWGQPVDALRPLHVPPAVAAAQEGDDGAPLLPQLWYDVVLVSDILFIALRDGLGSQLAHTIRGLAAHCRWVVECIVAGGGPEKWASGHEVASCQLWASKLPCSRAHRTPSPPLPRSQLPAVCVRGAPVRRGAGLDGGAGAAAAQGDGCASGRRVATTAPPRGGGAAQ